MQQLSALQSIVEFLQHHAPFHQMAADNREFLAKRLKLSFFAKGELITGPEDGVAKHYYIIKQGRVRGERQDSSDHNDDVWELVTGESFPIGALLAYRPVHTLHRAVEDTFVYELERADFEQLLTKSQLFHDFCTRRIANLLDTAMRKMRASSASEISGDSSLNTPLRALMHSSPISCSADTSVRSAMQTMEQAQRRSIAIVDESHQPLGILTLRDVMVRITMAELSIDTPIAEVMTPIEHCLSADDFAYQAALLMAQGGIGHVCIVEEKRFVGLVSERDLFSLQRVGLGNLSRAIQNADDIPTLKQLSNDMQKLIHQMMAQGASVDQLTQIISTLNDQLTQRVIIISEAKLGKPAIPYTWLAFGSEGRLEQTLKTDQDNGILFLATPGQSDEEARTALLPLAHLINQSLDQVGFPLCPGNIMASNPECCLSMDEWKSRFGRWVESGTPANLLKASIFFDFRSLYGDDQPSNELRDWLFERTKKNSLFRRMLAANALSNRPPLGVFGDFKLSQHGTHNKSIDLKLHGITPFVDAARLMALTHGLPYTNTLQRLRATAKTNSLTQEDIDAWSSAYGYIQMLRMRNHQLQLDKGEELDNYLEPEKLNSLDQRILKEAFRQARKFQSKLALDYQL